MTTVTPAQRKVTFIFPKDVPRATTWADLVAQLQAGGVCVEFRQEQRGPGQDRRRTQLRPEISGGHHQRLRARRRARLEFVRVAETVVQAQLDQAAS